MADDSMEVSLAVGDVYEPVAANHLIFMQHGVEGSTENFYSFVEKFKMKYGEEVYIVRRLAKLSLRTRLFASAWTFSYRDTIFST